jgi:hypothetical protein
MNIITKQEGHEPYKNCLIHEYTQFDTLPLPLYSILLVIIRLHIATIS